jgi:hypothetical protein
VLCTHADSVGDAGNECQLANCPQNGQGGARRPHERYLIQHGPRQGQEQPGTIPPPPRPSPPSQPLFLLPPPLPGLLPVCVLPSSHLPVLFLSCLTCCFSCRLGEEARRGEYSMAVNTAGGASEGSRRLLHIVGGGRSHYGERQGWGFPYP